MTTLDGNYELHLQNGGCPTIHPNGRYFCAGHVGHYDFFTSRHYVPTFDHRTKMYEKLEWN